MLLRQCQKLVQHLHRCGIPLVGSVDQSRRHRLETIGVMLNELVPIDLRDHLQMPLIGHVEIVNGQMQRHRGHGPILIRPQ
jgi:hypothetical protein